MNPIVIQLTPDTFEKFLVRKPQGEMWIVDYYAPWCGPCQQLTPIYRKLAKVRKYFLNVCLIGSSRPGIL